MLISLTIIAIVIVACVLCNKLTNKIGVPMLLAFILLGVIFGSDGIFKIPFDDFEFVEQVCTLDIYHVLWRIRNELEGSKACRAESASSIIGGSNCYLFPGRDLLLLYSSF